MGMSASHHTHRTRLPETAPSPARRGGLGWGEPLPQTSPQGFTPSQPLSASRERNQSEAHPSRVAVRIDIGTLRLHGYSAAQQQRFLRTLETQLAQKATARTDWPALASRHIARLAPLQVRAGTTPEKAAAMIAQQLFDLCTGHATEDRHG